jgi:hypothetical protein
MTPKEKAEDIYLKMLSWQDNSIEYLERNIISTSAKKCALIAVDEMIDIRNGLYINEGSITHQWLLEVKKEIEKL